jgi:phosphatidylglycerophosphate synthase
MVVVLFYRDLLTSVLRTFAMKRGVVIAARVSGKVKAVIEAAAIIAILVVAIKHVLTEVPSHVVYRQAYWIMWIVLAVAVWSGLDYFWTCRRHMVPPESAEEPGPGSAGRPEGR